MTRRWILPILTVIAAIALVGAVAYLETSNRSDVATSAPAPEPLVETTSTTTSTPESSPTVSTTTTDLPPTTVAVVVTSPTTTEAPPERSTVAVVVSSGLSSGTRLAPAAELFAAVGWTDVRPLTGSVARADTVVFYLEGFGAAAAQLAVDAGLAATAVAPMTEAPPVAGLADAELLFYFGGD